MSDITVDTKAFDQEVSVTLHFDYQPDEFDTDTRKSAELTQVDWNGIDVLELMGEDEVAELEQKLMDGEFHDDDREPF